MLRFKAYSLMLVFFALDNFKLSVLGNKGLIWKYWNEKGMKS
jgi:hypothetical protein